MFLEVRILEDNKDLENTLQQIAMPLVTHGTLKIGEFGKPDSTGERRIRSNNLENVFVLNPNVWGVFFLRPLVPDDSASQIRQIQKISSAYWRVS